MPYIGIIYNMFISLNSENLYHSTLNNKLIKVHLSQSTHNFLYFEYALE